MTPHAAMAPSVGQYHSIPIETAQPAPSEVEIYIAPWQNPPIERAFSPWEFGLRVIAGFVLLVAVLVALGLLAG